MKTKTLRVQDDLVAAVREVGKNEHIEESSAMRKLLRLGYEAYLAEQYRSGRVTLRHVASRMDVPMSEALDTLGRYGITGNVGADDTLASLRSLDGG